ncbi:MAG: D-alanyl-D-alanine carboxypeptidase family protein [Sporomusaceae bacterium]|nr:D-alanyl-D-alanine carboxypeptidase family protein [Sporomusaceae bacterium]
MYKKVLYFCLLVFLSWLLLYPAASCQGAPLIKAEAAILLDGRTGQVLYEKNSTKRQAPASTTKILTALLAIESGRLDEVVTVSPAAAATPGSTMQLYTGQKITMRELLTGLLLRSGNDAAVAIAQHLAGSTEAFAALMNQRALELGAASSHFMNPHGLSHADHYVSAYDLARITQYALMNQTFAAIVRLKETQIDWTDRRGQEADRNLRNTNKLLWMLPEADGVKTGTTGRAGPCLVASATKDNQQLIAVVLHDSARWHDAAALLNYGFSQFSLMDVAASGDVIAPVLIEKGLDSAVDALAAEDAALVIAAKNKKNATVEYHLPEIVKAPVYRGQKLGEIVFFQDQQAVKSVDLIAAKDVREDSLEQAFLTQLLKTYRLLSNCGL